MVTAIGIGGVPDPIGPKGPGNRHQKDSNDSGAIRDGVDISPEAKEAAETARISQIEKIRSEIREERVEEAKARIREGSYKVQDVVSQVASRLTRFL